MVDWEVLGKEFDGNLEDVDREGAIGNEFLIF
jgi:hypothetical protein